MANNLKRKFARSVERDSLTTFVSCVFGVPILAGIATSSLITPDAKQYEMDNFSNPDTIEKVEYLNRELQELNTEFIERKENIAEIDALKVQTSFDEVKTLYDQHEQSIVELNNDFNRFEYDLITMGVSEKDLNDISMTFNDLPISKNYDLDFNSDNVIAVNDVLKNMDKDKYNLSKNLRDDFSQSFRNRLPYKDKINNSMFLPLAGLSSLGFALLSLYILCLFDHSNLKKKWLYQETDKKKKKKKLNKSNPQSKKL